ncbi:MAG: hypothetical protein A2133_10425 [Actinobacteria bacterium RBG_16_64_13]|nr:MAG: hypothetical protein A2133_10425 [Actinobacteria bacterium RBG_16_64_13]
MSIDVTIHHSTSVVVVVDSLVVVVDSVELVESVEPLDVVVVVTGPSSAAATAHIPKNSAIAHKAIIAEDKTLLLTTHPRGFCVPAYPVVAIFSRLGVGGVNTRTPPTKVVSESST